MKEVRTNAAILNHAHHWRSKVSEDCSSLSTSSSQQSSNLQCLFALLSLSSWWRLEHPVEM